MFLVKINKKNSLKIKNDQLKTNKIHEHQKKTTILYLEKINLFLFSKVILFNNWFILSRTN
jgi:hypothetical protein